MKGSTQEPATASARRTALITGASSGIGEAFAEVFAAEGFDLVLTARREDRLLQAAERIRTQYGSTVDVIVADLSRREAPSEIHAELVTRGLAIDALVNNAGYGVPGSYGSSPWERHDALMQVMVVGLAELTYRLLPGMVERRYGRVINVASLAGLVPATAGHTLYPASKAFVIFFSEALAHEVKASGVYVTALCPGFTRSEFHDRTGTRDIVSKLPRWMWMDASVVARQGYDAVMAGIPVLVPGAVNRAIAGLVRYLPQSLVTAVGRKAGKLYRKAT
jgi:short-subunit dehydrogenase